MRKKSLIFMSVTMSLSILLSACGKRPVGETVKDNTVATTAPEVKEEKPKEEVKAEAPKEEPKKEEPKKEEPKAVEKKTATVATNNTSKPAEQPKQAVAPAQTVTTPAPTQIQQNDPSQEVPAFKEYHTLMQTAVPNNGKYKISFDKTQGPAPNLIYYSVDIPSDNRNFYKKIKNYVVNVNNAVVGTDDNLVTIDRDSSGNPVKYKSSMGISGYSNNPSFYYCYIIIIGSDGINYYEKMTYTITQ